MIIDFIIEDLMLNSYLQKNFHTLILTNSDIRPVVLLGGGPYIKRYSVLL